VAVLENIGYNRLSKQSCGQLQSWRLRELETNNDPHSHKQLNHCERGNKQESAQQHTKLAHLIFFAQAGDRKVRQLPT
jgi:hypothetical protein